MKRLIPINLFINSGKYISMTESESKLKILRENIKEFQASTGQKKYQWYEQGVVGIFDTIRTYEENTRAFKEYLIQLGLLPKLVNIKWSMLTNKQQEEIEPWAISVPSTIRFTVNSSHKYNHSSINEYVASLRNTSIDTQVGMWKHEKTKYELLHNEWKYYKKNVVPIMSQHKKIQLDQGSLTCISEEPKLYASDIYRVLGKEIFLECGTIKNELLMEYVTKGFIHKSELALFRKVRDVRLRYSLFLNERYDRRLDFLQDKLTKYSTNSQGR